MATMLSNIFATDQHDYGAIHELVAHQLANAPDQYNVGYFNMEGSLREIDLGGRTYILDRPLEINNCQLVVLRNGTLVAGPTFPKGEYLISCNRVVGISFFDLLLEWALLHKSAVDRTSPFPGQTYPATSVTGVPRAVNPLSTATRTWNSAT